MSEIKLDKIEEAIEAIKNGEVIIVVDDKDRENEGDFICAAEKITPEIVNFMATHGRGLICAPLVEERCDELGLELMVGKNTALHETPFTVSVDLIGHGCTTGISASDRAKTIMALAPRAIRLSMSDNCFSAEPPASALMYFAPPAARADFMAASSVFQRSSWKLDQLTPTTSSAIARPIPSTSNRTTAVVRIKRGFNI